LLVLVLNHVVILPKRKEAEAFALYFVCSSALLSSSLLP